MACNVAKMLTCYKYFENNKLICVCEMHWENITRLLNVWSRKHALSFLFFFFPFSSPFDDLHSLMHFLLIRFHQFYVKITRKDRNPKKFESKIITPQTFCLWLFNQPCIKNRKKKKAERKKEKAKENWASRNTSTQTQNPTRPSFPAIGHGRHQWKPLELAIIPWLSLPLENGRKTVDRNCEKVTTIAIKI